VQFITGVVDTGGKFTTVVVDIGGKFIAGFNNTADKKTENNLGLLLSINTPKVKNNSLCIYPILIPFK